MTFDKLVVWDVWDLTYRHTSPGPKVYTTGVSDVLFIYFDDSDCELEDDLVRLKTGPDILSHVVLSLIKSKTPGCRDNSK